MTTLQLTSDQRRIMTLVKAYPLGPLLIGIGLNWFVFGVNPAGIALPNAEVIGALAIAAVLLVINHTCIMTSTELTRVRFGLHATPEDWAASGKSPDDAPALGLRELERRHNAHRNATENTIYFMLLAFAFVLITPTTLAGQVWLLSFALARVGHTYGFLAGNTNVRGLFMSLSLLAMYGMASYLVLSVLVQQ